MERLERILFQSGIVGAIGFLSGFMQDRTIGTLTDFAECIEDELNIEDRKTLDIKSSLNNRAIKTSASTGGIVALIQTVFDKVQFYDPFLTFAAVGGANYVGIKAGEAFSRYLRNHTKPSKRDKQLFDEMTTKITEDIDLMSEDEQKNTLQSMMSLASSTFMKKKNVLLYREWTETTKDLLKYSQLYTKASEMYGKKSEEIFFLDSQKNITTGLAVIPQKDTVSIYELFYDSILNNENRDIQVTTAKRISTDPWNGKVSDLTKKILPYITDHDILLVGNNEEPEHKKLELARKTYREIINNSMQ